MATCSIHCGTRNIEEMHREIQLFPYTVMHEYDGKAYSTYECLKARKCLSDKKSDLSLTRIDMHPPTPEDFERFGERRKTDPIGQIVTGEFDNVNTPELIPIDIADPEDFDSTFAQQFAMGAGLGICGFVVFYMILCSLFGMR